ncbi:hypothetical protein [Flavobacterium eburneipallidum]|uniref:hypothetical protein n=1 Tax=Flavobacterium eburneipallidum TaxID=3003263 RepID=UPI0022AC25EB|nr:hypothetical protein [Flavobacterium eburneipallidum]
MSIKTIIMGALELRDSVLEYINTADERLLKVVKAVIESYQENDIVAYAIDGTPLTRTTYKAELQEAKEEIKRGEYISQEDLEKESNNW